MRYIHAGLFTFLTLILLLPAHAEHVVDDSEKPNYQFIISGDSGTLKDGELTLKGVPIVTFYSLGKDRGAGHFFVESFVKVWNEDASLLEKDPPNGTVSVLDKDGSSGANLELSDPEANLNVITFKARVLEGGIPEEFGPFSLYIRFPLKGHLKTQQ